jgi:hypothetical protein
VPPGKKNEAAESMAHRDECHHPATKPGEPQQTNFHFHGFHVTPRNHKVGNVMYYGDNVLVCSGTGKSHINGKQFDPGRVSARPRLATTRALGALQHVLRMASDPHPPERLPRREHRRQAGERAR